MASMSIHRALTLISQTENTLNAQILRGIFVSTVSGGDQKPTDSSFKTIKELQTRIQSDTDKVESSLKLIVKLKQAIAASNLETKVNFNGTSVTITELLALKQTLTLRKNFTRRLSSQISTANAKVEEAKNLAIKKAEGNVQNLKLYESLEGVSIVTQNSESPALKLERLEKENEFLENEIDILLSENNLQTLITIED